MKAAVAGQASAVAADERISRVAHARPLPMMPADDLILDALQQLAPASVLVLGGPAPAGLKAYQRQQRSQDTQSVACGVTVLDALPAGEEHAATLAQRYSVAIVIGMERLPDPRARATLAALRDRLCDAVLVVVPEEHWSATEWLALGFEADARCDQDGRTIVLYRYDAASANPEREWNNPQDWAHPENFRRYRW